MNLTRRSSRLRGAAGAPRHRSGWHKRPDGQASTVVMLRLPRSRRPRGRVHSNQPLLDLARRARLQRVTD
jgi:hypothetical protein